MKLANVLKRAVQKSYDLGVDQLIFSKYAADYLETVLAKPEKDYPVYQTDEHISSVLLGTYNANRNLEEYEKTKGALISNGMPKRYVEDIDQKVKIGLDRYKNDPEKQALILKLLPYFATSYFGKLKTLDSDVRIEQQKVGAALRNAGLGEYLGASATYSTAPFIKSQIPYNLPVTFNLSLLKNIEIQEKKRQIAEITLSKDKEELQALRQQIFDINQNLIEMNNTVETQPNVNTQGWEEKLKAVPIEQISIGSIHTKILKGARVNNLFDLVYAFIIDPKSIIPHIKNNLWEACSVILGDTPESIKSWLLNTYSNDPNILSRKIQLEILERTRLIATLEERVRSLAPYRVAPSPGMKDSYEREALQEKYQQLKRSLYPETLNALEQIRALSRRLEGSTNPMERERLIRLREIEINRIKTNGKEYDKVIDLLNLSEDPLLQKVEINPAQDKIESIRKVEERYRQMLEYNKLKNLPDSGEALRSLQIPHALYPETLNTLERIRALSRRLEDITNPSEKERLIRLIEIEINRIKTNGKEYDKSITRQN
jgi:hypothetical protein